MSIDHLGFNIYQISWEILNCQDTDSENQKKTQPHCVARGKNKGPPKSMDFIP